MTFSGLAEGGAPEPGERSVEECWRAAEARLGSGDRRAAFLLFV
jgi:hypothetical protein